MNTDIVSAASMFSFVGMAGDPLGKWNLTMTGYSDCLKKVMAWKKPLLVLGGGQYRFLPLFQVRT